MRPAGAAGAAFDASVIEAIVCAIDTHNPHVSGHGQALDLARSRIRRFVDGYAPNTIRTFGIAARRWMAYCRRTGTPIVPASLDSVETYLRERRSQASRATLESDVYFLRKLHRLVDLPDPLGSLDGEMVLRNLRKHRKGDRQPRQAVGMTVELLVRILDGVRYESPRDIRDAAMLMVAYNGMLRRDELVSLELGDVVRQNDGTMQLKLQRSKTDQTGVGVRLKLWDATQDAVRHWIDCMALTQDTDMSEGAPLFRSMPSKRAPMQRALQGRDVSRIFKQRAAAAGLDPAVVAGISGHSGRVGATQDLFANGIDLGGVMLAGRWKSTAMPMRYGEHIAVESGAMASLEARLAKANALPRPPKSI